MRALTMSTRYLAWTVDRENLDQQLENVTVDGPVLGVSFESYAWPGGYPVYHMTRDGGILCPHCANEHISLTADNTNNADPQWSIVDSEVNWEDPDLVCDHCGKVIDCACSED